MQKNILIIKLCKLNTSNIFIGTLNRMWSAYFKCMQFNNVDAIQLLGEIS